MNTTDCNRASRRQPIPRRVAAIASAAVKLLLACACVVATWMATAATAHAETSVIGGPGQYAQPATLSAGPSTGYTGQRQMLPSQWCTNWVGGTAGIQSATFWAFRAPAYDAYTQTIRMDVRIDWLSSAGWQPLAWAPPESISTRPGQYPRFQVRSFTVTPGYYFYRLVHAFSWTVNGTVVGRAFDTVNGDTVASNGNAPVIRTTGAGQGACLFGR